MTIQLEVKSPENQQRITWRERLSIKLLLAIFVVVFPARWDHQTKEFIKVISDELDKAN